MVDWICQVVWPATDRPYKGTNREGKVQYVNLGGDGCRPRVLGRVGIQERDPRRLVVVVEEGRKQEVHTAPLMDTLNI